jgi:phosphatidylserine decarboxylase
MTFYNVHVNWVPISGEVIHKDHFQGEHFLAWQPKSSAENEHTTVVVRTHSGRLVTYRQIAGWIARRIVCYANKGDIVEHKAFGRGMVLSVLKMGGDALLEIAFDQIGTKKLMAKTASVHMKKV